MNKIYKLIWNKAKNCWVVASELAKGHGKNKSKSRKSVLAVFVMLALLGSTFLPADMVSAEDPADDGQIHYVSVGVNKKDKIKIRKNIYENGRIVRQEEEEVEIEPNNNYSPIKNPSYNAILIGPEARTGRGDATESVINGVIAIGTKSMAMKQYSTALGTNAWAGAKGDIAVGWKSYTGSSKELEDSNKIAIGTESSALEQNGISIGNKSMARDTNAIAIGNEAETGSASNAGASYDSIAVGNKVKVQGQYNVAIGSGVTVGTKNDGSSYVVAIGSDSHAYDTDSIVIGGHSEVRENATVIGNRSKAGMESVALGSSIEAGEWSIAIGLSSKAHNHAIAMGMNSDVAGEYAIGIGEEARSFANQSVSMGYQAHAYVGESLAIGNSALVAGEKISKEAYNALSDAEKKNYTHDSYGNFYYKKSSESYSSTAVGPQARVYGKNATALGSANVGDIFGNRIADGGTAVGSSANAAYENATAVGYNSIAYAKDAVTLGANTRADIADGVALGSESTVGRYGRTDINNAGRYGYDPFDESREQESPTWKSTKAAVSVGDKEKNITRQIVNLAAGKDDTDAVNVAQLKNLKYRAAADLETAEKRLNQGIQNNAGDISNLSTKVDGNTSNINDLKNQRLTDMKNLNNSIEGHTTRFVSVNRENTNKTSDNYLNDGAKKAGSIAIGVNTHAYGEDAVTLGYNSFSRGQGSVIIGETSNHSTLATATPKEEQFKQSIIVGSQNEVYARKKDSGGREDTILGSKNHITESHGTFVRGVGNYVADAYNDEALTDEDKQKEQDFLDPLDGGDPIGLFQKGRSHVTVDGDGNSVAGAIYTRVSGVGNEVSNTDYDDGRPSTPRLSYNIVTGNRNTVVDSSHNLILGDNHELENVNGNIIIGSLKTKAKTEASNVTVLGNEANVTVDGGVALGTGSVADRAAGMQGYISLDKKKTIADGYKGMGSADDYDYHTRQLPNLDKKYKEKVQKYEEILKQYEQETDQAKKKNLESKLTNAEKAMNRALQKKQASELALQSIEAAWQSTKGAVSVGGYTVDTNGNRKLETRQITGVAAGTEDTDAVNVAQLKASTTRYFSVHEVIPKFTSKTILKKKITYTGVDEWGYKTKGNEINDGAVGEGSVAVGENAQALQKYGAALGYGAKAKEERSLALGLRAEAEGNGAVAMGGFSIVEATGKNSIALGYHSRVTAANSIALGAESFVGKLDDIKTDAYLTGDKDKFTAENGVVSVGRTGYKKWTKKWQWDSSTKREKEVVTEETVPDSYRRIVNVAGGAEDTDAVNVAQLKAGRTTVEAGDYVTVTSGQKTGVDGTVYTVKGPKLTSKDTNLTVTDEEETVAGTTDKKKVGYKLELSKTLTGLESVSSKVFNAGNNVTLGETGLTITGGPSVTTTGIDAGSKKIINVTDGDVSENSTDAVNGGQLYKLQQTVAGNKVTVEAAKNSQITVTPETQADKSTKYVVDIAKDGTIGGAKDGNLVTGDTVKKYVDANKVTVTGDEDGSGVKVENVAKTGEPANYKVSLGNKIKAGDVTVDGTEGKGQITGLSNKTWDAGNIVSGRAATEDQLKAVSQNAAEAAKKHTTVVAGDYVTVSEGTNANGGKEYTVTGPKLTVVDGEENLVVGDIMDGNKKVGYELKLNKELKGLTSVSSTTFKAGDNVTLNDKGLTITNGPSVKKDGIDAGKKKITNVADGDVSENSTDAVNGGQLYKLQQTVAGNKVTVEAAKNSQITVTPETQADKSTKYVVDIAKDGTIGGAKDGNLVTGDTVKKYVDANKVTVTGDEDGSGVKVENVAKTGEPANYKVSLGNKIKAGDVTVDGTEGKGQITGLSNKTWDAGNIVSGRAATEDQLKAVSQNAAEAAKKHTTVVAGDYVTVSEGTNANGGKEYTVTGPKLTVVDGEENLVVGDIMDGNKKVGYELKLNKELKGLTSVSSTTFKAGDNVTLNDKGLTITNGPSVTAAGIDAGKNKITGVAAGAVSEKSTEAVNGGQLFGVEQKANINNQNISILGGKVNELNARVDRVSAGTAALAALHPLDFDPDDKWDFAAGYGNYKGANAAAIGAYYRPNEDTMFSVGGSFGGGENMVNAGVSVKFGQGNHVTTSKIAMAKEIKDLRAEVEVLRQAVTGIRQGKTPDPVKMKLFPDIAKNHWAYEAVEKLTKQGLLEGYPDGTFGGDRMMTRYEFAEIVYRAVQKGLNVSEKLIQEFEPELERFRVDVISKDKDGNPVIERVRVNEKKKAK